MVIRYNKIDKIKKKIKFNLPKSYNNFFFNVRGERGSKYKIRITITKERFDEFFYVLKEDCTIISE